MVQLRQRLRFLLEPLGNFWIAFRRLGENFNRDHTTQPHLSRLVDSPHTTTPNALYNLVIRYRILQFAALDFGDLGFPNFGAINRPEDSLANAPRTKPVRSVNGDGLSTSFAGAGRAFYQGNVGLRLEGRRVK